MKQATKQLIQTSLDRLREMNAGPQDPECSHIEADNILCDVLVALGQQELVDEWTKVEKWYA